MKFPPSQQRHRIGPAYFADYHRGRPYGDPRQWRDQTLDYGGSNILSYYLGYCRRHGLPCRMPHSLLDVGAANGALMRRIQRQHPNMEIHGIESSAWAKKNVLSSVKDAIVFDDWLDVSAQYETDEYDLVLDFVSQYIPADNLHWSMSELGRVANMAVITVFAPSDIAPRHKGQLHHRTRVWWRHQIDHHASGPVECYRGCNFIWHV